MARRESLGIEGTIEKMPFLEESIVYCGRSFKVRFPYGEFAKKLLRKDAHYQKLGFDEGEIEKAGEVIRGYFRKAEDVMTGLKTGFIMLNADDESIFFPVAIAHLSFPRKGGNVYVDCDDKNSGLFFDVIFGKFNEVIFQRPDLETAIFSLYSPLISSPLFLRRDTISQDAFSLSLVVTDMGRILKCMMADKNDKYCLFDVGYIGKTQATPFVEGVL